MYDSLVTAYLETVVQGVVVIHVEALAPGHVQVRVEGHHRHGPEPALDLRHD